MATVGAGSVIGFSHPLLASAVYDDATPAERRRAHRVLAETLQDPVERARHRSRSITAPDEVVAADLERAAELSKGRGAPQSAGELLEGAALATPAPADTNADADANAGLERWLRAVDTYSEAGNAGASRAALCKGAGLATTPEQQAQVLVRRIRLAQDVPTARALAEQVLRLVPTGSGARPEVLCNLASVCRLQGDGTRALELARNAVTEAAAAKRPDIQLIALIERLAVEQLWGAGADLREESSRAIEELARDARLPMSFLALTRSFNASWDDPMADRHARDGIEWAVEAGQYGDLPRLYVGLIVVLIRKSKVREARAAQDEAARSGAWAPAIRDWAFNAQKDVVDILVDSHAGELDAARERARTALARPGTQESTYLRGAFLALLGFVETSARNWQAALEALRELAEIFAKTGMVDLESLLWGVDYADAALQVGATEDVEAAVAVLRRQGSAGKPEAAVAADRCQALLTAARGDVDDALAKLREIVDRPGSESPFEAARSRLALGQVYRRAGYRGRSAQTLAAAADAFDELGTPRWAERARDEAGRVAPHSTTSTLTATEHRVAELVAAGRSNQETADELFVSVKTVEANLTRIYRKLSVRSRTELANRMGTAKPGPQH
ncbi:LuxR C-terminal-related transcriptional regulator [Streptomyces sp. NPDC018026]|uniref:helix-turn-helix transcriptional regulator n=1 Tax=Streptomyces sp. NPDC018026 TaxID=3365031 RepID=UPI00379544F7